MRLNWSDKRKLGAIKSSRRAVYNQGGHREVTLAVFKGRPVDATGVHDTLARVRVSRTEHLHLRAVPTAPFGRWGQPPSMVPLGALIQATGKAGSRSTPENHQRTRPPYPHGDMNYQDGTTEQNQSFATRRERFRSSRPRRSGTLCCFRFTRTSRAPPSGARRHHRQPPVSHCHVAKRAVAQSEICVSQL